MRNFPEPLRQERVWGNVTRVPLAVDCFAAEKCPSHRPWQLTHPLSGYQHVLVFTSPETSKGKLHADGRHRDC
jgi:hypothetical protein